MINIHGFGLPSTDNSASFHLPDVKGQWDPLCLPLRVESSLLQASEASQSACCPSCHCLGLPAFPKSLSSLHVISLFNSQQPSNLRKLCIVANQQRALNLVVFSLNCLMIHTMLFSAYLSLRHPVPPTWWHLLHPQCCVKWGHFEWPLIGACSSKVTRCDPLIPYLIKTY